MYTLCKNSIWNIVWKFVKTNRHHYDLIYRIFLFCLISAKNWFQIVDSNSRIHRNNIAFRPISNLYHILYKICTFKIYFHLFELIKNQLRLTLHQIKWFTILELTKLKITICKPKKHVFICCSSASLFLIKKTFCEQRIVTLMLNEVETFIKRWILK